MGEKSTQADDMDAGRASAGPRDVGSGQAAGIAVSDPGAPGTKSATREAGDVNADGQPDIARATNLNSSKSNTYREGGGGGDPTGPLEATNLNSSRSSNYRQAPPATPVPPARPSPGPAEPGTGPATPAGGP